MDPATIAIVTMTWARTRDEEDVALPYIHPCPPISGGVGGWGCFERRVTNGFPFSTMPRLRDGAAPPRRCRLRASDSTMQ